MAEATTDEGTYRKELQTWEKGKTKQALAWRANLVGLAMEKINERMAVMGEMMGVIHPARNH